MALTTALVTGASSGIGEAMAWRLAIEGHNLVLVARRKDRLDSLARKLMDAHRCTVTVVPLDLTRPGAVEALHKRLQQEHIVIDILVNNAGVGHHAPVIDLPVAQAREEIDLNIAALTELCQRFGGDMAKRGLGKILNVASVAAFQPGPLMAVYAASKAYVLSFSEAFRQELRGTGVSVTVVCPGPVDSEFHQAAGTRGRLFLTLMPMMGPDALAQAALRAMNARVAVTTPGLMNRLTALTARLLPRTWMARMVHLLMRH